MQKFLRRNLSKLSPFRLLRRNKKNTPIIQAQEKSDISDFQKEKDTYEYAMKVKDLGTESLAINLLLVGMIHFLERSKNCIPTAVHRNYEKKLSELQVLKHDNTTDSKKLFEKIAKLYKDFSDIFKHNLAPEDEKLSELQNIFDGSKNPEGRVTYTLGFAARIQAIILLKIEIEEREKEIKSTYRIKTIPTYSWTKPKLGEQFDYVWNPLQTEKKFKVEEKPAMQRAKASSSSNSSRSFWRKIFRRTNHDLQPTSAQVCQP